MSVSFIDYCRLPSQSQVTPPLLCASNTTQRTPSTSTIVTLGAACDADAGVATDKANMIDSTRTAPSRVIPNHSGLSPLRNQSFIATYLSRRWLVEFCPKRNSPNDANSSALSSTSSRS